MSNQYHKSLYRAQRDQKTSDTINLAVCILSLPVVPVCWFLIFRAFLGI